LTAVKWFQETTLSLELKDHGGMFTNHQLVAKDGAVNVEHLFSNLGQEVEKSWQKY